MHQKPRTVEEIAALPEGPAFGSHETACTDEDRARGYIEIEGKRHKIEATTRFVRRPVNPGLAAYFAEPGLPDGYRDEDDVLWMLCRYADGSFYRRRMNA